MAVIIKEIVSEDIDSMALIQQSAYAASYHGTLEEREALKVNLSKVIENDDVTALGAYKNDVMVGCVLYYVFETNLHGNMIKTAGIGSLAVDLLYKKEKIAQQLIKRSFEISEKAGIDLYSLYPFKIGFYRDFGFGYGTPINTYCIAPKDFKEFSNKHILEYGSKDNLDEVFEFYDRYAETKNGLSKKTNNDKRRLKEMKQSRILLARHQGELIGYSVFSQEGINKINNQSQKLNIREIIYSKRDALLAFSTFFNSQQDQIDYVQIHTFDSAFHHILTDINYVPEPKTMDIISIKSSDSALGLMHYALNPENLLKYVEARTTESICFNITYPRAIVKKPCFVNKGKKEPLHITLKLNDFSSWIVGASTLSELYEHGSLETDDENILKTLDHQFNFDRPNSYTSF